MDYTLQNVHQKILFMCDKMGSDYFPLPITLNFFETSTWSFLGERLRHLEKNQEITDDIRNLIIPKVIPIIEDPNIQEKYIAAIPSDYHRLVRFDVAFTDGYINRLSRLSKQGGYNIAKRNPNREPNKRYPLVLQESGYFHIDSGTDVPSEFKIMYCKKPTFATTGDQSARIVNLPDDVIENILLDTVTRLFSKTADERQQPSYKLEDVFRKAFK